MAGVGLMVGGGSERGEKPDRDWIRELFIKYGNLFLEIISDERMWKAGEDLAGRLARLLKPLGVTSGRILEVGCGNGRVLLHLAKHGYEAFGVDISPILIEDGRRCAEAIEG